MSAATAREVVNEILGMPLPDYTERFLKIRTKTEGMQPLRLNPAQLYLHSKAEIQLQSRGFVRISLLKARQWGGSTYVQGRFYSKLSRGAKGQRAFILTHQDKATANIFAMTRRYHDNLDPRIRPYAPKPSQRQLIFPKLDSSYAVATAGTKDVGRSDTIQLFHGCLAVGTPVLMFGHDAIAIEDVRVGDTVMTHSGALASVSYISEQQKLCRSLVLKGMRSLPIICTDEHRFWTRDGWKEAKDIIVGEAIGFPIREIQGSVDSLPVEYSQVVRVQGGGTQPTGVPNSISLSYDVGRIVGLYLAEGYIIRSKGGLSSGVSFAVHEDEVPRTIQWLLQSGLPNSSITTHERRSKTRVVNLYGRPAAEWMEALCGSVKTKGWPARWSEFPVSFVEGMVAGYLAGDGHVEKKTRRIRASSIRSSLTFGCREALASLGYGWASISYCKAALRNGRNERAQWTLSLTGTGVDELWKLLGKGRPPPRLRSSDRYGDVQVVDGYAWVPVVAVVEAGEQSVFDLEIDHEDHSYCIAQGATHNSECAMWDNDTAHMAGALQAVPAQGQGTEVFLESTGMGQGNAFYWNFMNALAGLSEYAPVFVPWFWIKEYQAPLDSKLTMTSDDEVYLKLWGLDLRQMQFRYNKIMEFGGGEAGRSKFQQEYPCTPLEAFSQNVEGGFIEAKYVLMARAKQPHMVSVFGPKIMGIDPAYTGNDRFITIMRQGRLAVRVGRWRKLRTQQSHGRLVRLIHEYRPDIICIDAGGVGGPFYDLLVPVCDSLGIQIIPVLGGEVADDPERFPRKRVENAARCREWFEDAQSPCIYDLAPPPKDSGVDGLDEIQADITAPICDWDTVGRAIIETKKAILRHAVSPDNLEALMNTFTLRFDASWKPKADSVSLSHARRPINWRAI